MAVSLRFTVGLNDHPHNESVANEVAGPPFTNMFASDANESVMITLPFKTGSPDVEAPIELSAFVVV
jgi:hypothetical protein